MRGAEGSCREHRGDTRDPCCTVNNDGVAGTHLGTFQSSITDGDDGNEGVPVDIVSGFESMHVGIRDTAVFRPHAVDAARIQRLRTAKPSDHLAADTAMLTL